MNIIKKISLLAIGTVLITGCSHQQARKPISQTSNEFMKASILRNKKLIKGEEGKIDSVIKSNPKIQYIASKKGYWYYYEVKNENDTVTPKKGDIAYFDYELKDLDGNVIYSDVELRPQVYKVDKQNILMGLRDGIKLMHRKEKVTFLFPSHMGYGYRGDTKNIPANTPLMATVTLNDFKKDVVEKTETEAETKTE